MAQRSRSRENRRETKRKKKQYVKVASEGVAKERLGLRGADWDSFKNKFGTPHFGSRSLACQRIRPRRQIELYKLFLD